MPLPQDATSIDSIMADVHARTIALVAYVRRLGDADLAAPSRLPGWTRGHVTAHLAANADAFTAALTRAHTDDDAGLMYASQAARDREIETGAGRGAAAQLQTLLDSAERFASAWRDLPADHLTAVLTGTAGWTRPVADVPWMRWRELALHVVDLGGEGDLVPGDPLVARLLDEVVDGWVRRETSPSFTVDDTERSRSWQVGSGGTSIAGSTADLALWLTGRSDGSVLTASGPLPTLPPWL